MTQHYLKIVLRNMRRFKLQTIVCLTGLAVGMTCFALGTLWLRYIESFEDFVPDGDNICLATYGQSQFYGSYDYMTDFLDAQLLVQNLPQVEDACVLWSHVERRRSKVTLEDETEGELLPIKAETKFFDWFGIKALEGSPKNMKLNEMALTESAARRLFGSEQAIGRQVQFPRHICNEPMVVAAIIPDCPNNTQFRYEAILPFSMDDFMKQERITVYQTLVKLHPAAARDSIVGRPFTISVPREDPNHWAGPMITREYELAPLRSLRSDYVSANIPIATAYVRWFMALGLLVIACSLINYIITMTLHLRRRGWEFSLRRVLGSSRVHILYMVSLETLILFLLSAALAGLLTWLVLPTFREYSGIDIAWNAMAQRLAAYLALVIASGMALSALTAWMVMWRTQRNVLSSRQLTPSLRGRGHGGEVLQMALSMGIIFAAVVMVRQVHFLAYSDELGFAHTEMGVVTQADEEMCNKIRQSPLVEETFFSLFPIFPITVDMSATISRDSLRQTGETVVQSSYLDDEVLRYFRMKLLAGQLPEGDSICVNETMCRTFGFTPETVIGQEFYTGSNHRLTVCGVVQDAYVLGPAVPPSPTYYEQPRKLTYTSERRTLSFRAKPGRFAELKDSVRSWRDEQAQFIDAEEQYNEFIQSEQMLIKILMAVGGASLFVCVIGTFSLVSLSLQQRRKEIAVRKVHGAKMRDILSLFLKGQVLSLGIAAVIAYPVAYIIMKHWLEGYAKQVAIDWWLIPLTFLAIAAVVLLTITVKIWRAAKESTVEALNS